MNGIWQKKSTMVIYLDAEYDKILPQSWVVIERPLPADPEDVKSLNFNKMDESQGVGWIVSKIEKVRTVSRARYGITGTVTKLTLKKAWLTQTEVDNNDERKIDISMLRGTIVYAQSELLTRAEETIEDDVCLDLIELDGLYEGLKSGRWLIVSGERSDIESAKGAGQVKTSELVMLAAVGNGKKTIVNEVQSKGETLPGGDNDNPQPLPDDKTHTFLKLSVPLAYCYRRDTVSIYANVTKATHGETRNEVLGSGDGSRAFQEFQLRQSPLTYLAAPTPAGAESTLKARVDDVLWHETDSLAGLEPIDRNYITTTDDDAKTTVVYGQRRARISPAHGRRECQGCLSVGYRQARQCQSRTDQSSGNAPPGCEGSDQSPPCHWRSR